MQTLIGTQKKISISYYMKLIFNIDYRTNWGESVYVVGDIAELGAGDYNKAPKLALNGNSQWTIELEVPNDASFTYRYFVRNDEGEVKNEWGKGNCFCGSHSPVVRFFDRWQDQPFDKPYYASAFTDCICRHSDDRKVKAERGFVTLVLAAPMVAPDDVMTVVGANPSMGEWQPQRALRMSAADFPLWKVNIPAEGLRFDTEYKFLIVKKDSGEVVSWEGGRNRTVGINPSAGEATVLRGMRFINEQKLWRGAGTAIPVFSLRSNSDMGVGDFMDLIPMVDWAVATGQKFLQLLPINDTTMSGTWTDSYPYNANSTFALHPMYLRVTELGKLKDANRQRYYDEQAAKLNALAEVDYEAANALKKEYIDEIFEQEGAATLGSDDYKNFVVQNQSWLMPYAAFCVLRDKFGTPDFNQWGKYAEYSEAIQAKVLKANSKEADKVIYVQYHLDRQMRRVHDYANSHGVAIKGDIPIGISRTSVDAWQYPQLFYMDCQAGAPPDDFSVLGQNWGLPTYNWEEMNKDGFAWWKARMVKMSDFFDAYRIDHVLGFFRIWQIPMNAVHGLLGYFNPALPFTIDELRYNYDFWLDTSVHTTPYIMEYFVEDFFGPYKNEAVKIYLKSMGGGRYRLRDEFDTQRKIVDYFASQPKNEKNSRICDGLLGLADEVLFIEDPEQKGHYHPRISAQYTYVYRSLNDYERWCFNRLYNDFFYHRHNDFWYGKAMWKLPPLINSTDMLVCAEDLGMIPSCVPAVIEQLEILSLEIQRMPKDPSSSFGNTWNYPYFSVCTTSTHDMGGIRQWWEEDRDSTQRYFNEVLHEQGASPYYAEPWVCDRIVDLHLQSPSMLCILPLQDWLSIDGSIRREDPREEQINVPANSRHYWRYRMHLTVDELIDHKEFNDYLKTKITNSDR